MDGRPERRNPAASLSDELIVEILSRLPVRSVCRFKCVSRSWRGLISDRGNRKKLPHTLAGFFYRTYDCERSPYMAHHFTNVSGKGIPFVYPSFSFLPVPSDDIFPLDCCNGLLLCRCFQPGPPVADGIQPFHYAVCNPATEKWVILPDGSWASGDARTARLCFDPAISSHFHVIEYVVDEGDYVTGVEIYSSRTGAWTPKAKGMEWNGEVSLLDDTGSVFLNGFLHTLTLLDAIVAVDMDGKTWRTIPTPPRDDFGSIHQAQGRLCYFNHDASKVSVWMLDDYGTDEWVPKHTVSALRLFGRKSLRFDPDYKVIAVHPECNLVFFVYGWDKTLIAYEMDRGEVRVIRNLGHDCSPLYLPYVPLFSESLADGH